MRTLRNQLAEAFICGMQVGAEQPDLTGDGDEMYQAFRDWIDRRTECRSCLGLGFKGGIVDATGGACESCHGSGWEQT